MTTPVSTLMPVLFLSHGGGPCWFMSESDSPTSVEMNKDSKSATFMRTLVKTQSIPKPKAILVISAHWETSEFSVTTHPNPPLYFDYYGFPPHTYKLTWPVPGAPDVAGRVKQLLEKQGIQCLEDSKRGLDHGVFVPLKLAFPDADVPVLQMSLKRTLNIDEHMKAAEALTPLRSEGVLIIGSGQSTHNFNTFRAPYTKPDPWLHKFRDWMDDIAVNKSHDGEMRKKKLLASHNECTFSSAHSRIEHYLPFPMAIAAAQYVPGKKIYDETVSGNMLMTCFRFG